MINKYNNVYLFLSFLPLVLLPLSVTFSILLTALMLIYGMSFKDQSIFQKSLNPLSVALIFGIIIGTVQFFLLLLSLLGNIFSGVNLLNFAYVMSKILSFVNLLLLLLLVLFTIFAIIAIKHNKQIPLFHKLIDFFNKTTSSSKQDEMINDIEEQ